MIKESVVVAPKFQLFVTHFLVSISEHLATDFMEEFPNSFTIFPHFAGAWLP
jgi:hypothetical protein